MSAFAKDFEDLFRQIQASEIRDYATYLNPKGLSSLNDGGPVDKCSDFAIISDIMYDANYPGDTQHVKYEPEITTLKSRVKNLTYKVADSEVFLQDVPPYPTYAGFTVSEPVEPVELINPVVQAPDVLQTTIPKQPWTNQVQQISYDVPEYSVEKELRNLKRRVSELEEIVADQGREIKRLKQQDVRIASFAYQNQMSAMTANSVGIASGRGGAMVGFAASTKASVKAYDMMIDFKKW